MATSLEILKLEAQLVNVRGARMNNQVKIAELGEVIERIQKDVQISLDKETELEQLIKEKKGN